jgi:hypothetical protein
MRSLLGVLERLLTSDRLFPTIVILACLAAFVPLLIQTGGGLLFVDVEGKPFDFPGAIDCDCGHWAMWQSYEPLTGAGRYRCERCGKTLRYSRK